MSSPLRSVLRARLTAAMRQRDRGAVSVLRTTVAAIENAEAVPAPDAAAPTTSPDLALAALGVGAPAAERRRLDHGMERDVVAAELHALHEAEAVYAAAGDVERARAAAAGAELLRSVLDEAGRRHGEGDLDGAG